MLAKGFYNKGKPNQAKPLLQKLCAINSMNWADTYYATSFYMQEGSYLVGLKKNDFCLKRYCFKTWFLIRRYLKIL